jgi:hypothetical protein
MTVAGNLTLTNGTLDVSTSNYGITIGGNFARTSGTFTPRNGTVTFNDNTKTSLISGSTTFYNLSCTTAGKAITVTAGTTQTISGTLTLTGASGSLIVLNSSDGATRFTFDVASAQTVSYVDVSNSQVSSSGGTFDITANNSIDRANTDSGEAAPHWIFPSAGATKMAFFAQPTNTVYGSIINSPGGVQIEIQNAGSNRVTSGTYAVTIAIASGSGTLSGTTTVNSVNGLATFSDLKISAVGAYTLSVTSSPVLTGATSNSFNITQAPLTITANNVPKTYGTALTGGAGSTAFTSSGLQNGETIGSVTIAYGTGAAANAAVATYTGSVTPSLATGGTFTASNYSITYNSGNIIVSAAPLTVTASDQTKTYGDSNLGSSAFTSSGLQNGETIGSVTLSTNATPSTSGNYTAGSWTITPSAATGGTFTASNYSITYVDGALTVNKKTLTVTATGINKVADGGTTATVNLSDDRILLDTFTASYASANFDTAAAGTGKTVTVNGISISGTDANNYTLASTSATTTADITPAAISKIVFLSGAQTITQGEYSSAMTVQTQDAYGNASPVTGSAASLGLSTDSAQGKFYDAVGGTQITSVSISVGSTNATFYYKDDLVGTPTITVAKSGWTSATQQETIAAAVISKLAFTTSAQTLTAGVISGIITVQTQTAGGTPINTASNITVNLSSDSTGTKAFYSDAAGTNLITSVTITTGSNSASFYYKDTKAATPTITAHAAGQTWTDATQQETVVAAAASKLVWNTQPASPVTAGDTWTAFKLEIQDAFGNLCTTATNTITIKPSSGSFATGTITKPAVGGIVTFDDLTYTATASGLTLHAEGTGLTNSPESNSITVKPAALGSFAVTGISDPTTAGSSNSALVTAYDLYGNVKTDYVGTVHLSSNDTQAALPADYTFVSGDNGAHTFTGIILKTAGSKTVTASDSGKTGSQTVTVKAAAATSIIISDIPAPYVSGTSISITVTAKDPYGNIATGYAGTVHFASSDSKATLPADYTFTPGDGGEKTFSPVILVTAGTQSISVTDSTLSDSQSLTVNNKPEPAPEPEPPIDPNQISREVQELPNEKQPEVTPLILTPTDVAIATGIKLVNCDFVTNEFGFDFAQVFQAPLYAKAYKPGKYVTVVTVLAGEKVPVFIYSYDKNGASDNRVAYIPYDEKGNRLPQTYYLNNREWTEYSGEIK